MQLALHAVRQFLGTLAPSEGPGTLSEKFLPLKDRLRHHIATEGRQASFIQDVLKTESAGAPLTYSMILRRFEDQINAMRHRQETVKYHPQVQEITEGLNLDIKCLLGFLPNEEQVRIKRFDPFIPDPNKEGIKNILRAELRDMETFISIYRAQDRGPMEILQLLLKEDENGIPPTDAVIIQRIRENMDYLQEEIFDKSNHLRSEDMSGSGVLRHMTHRLDGIFQLHAETMRRDMLLAQGFKP